MKRVMTLTADSDNAKTVVTISMKTKPLGLTKFESGQAMAALSEKIMQAIASTGWVGVRLPAIKVK